MSAMVCDCSRAVFKYIWHLDSCGITDNSDISDSSESTDKNKNACKTVQQFESAIGIF